MSFEYLVFKQIASNYTQYARHSYEGHLRRYFVSIYGVEEEDTSLALQKLFHLGFVTYIDEKNKFYKTSEVFVDNTQQIIPSAEGLNLESLGLLETCLQVQ